MGDSLTSVFIFTFATASGGLISFLLSKIKPWLVFVVPVLLGLIGVYFVIGINTIATGWDQLGYLIFGIFFTIIAVTNLIVSTIIFVLKLKKIKPMK